MNNIRSIWKNAINIYKTYNYSPTVQKVTFVSLVGIKTIHDYYYYTNKTSNVPISTISITNKNKEKYELKIAPTIAHVISSGINVVIFGCSGLIVHIVFRYII